jgi:hypothetical protein
MPVSLFPAHIPTELLAVHGASVPQTSTMDRISGWLNKAKQRRAERLLAQTICAAGIRDFSTHRD